MNPAAVGEVTSAAAAITVIGVGTCIPSSVALDLGTIDGGRELGIAIPPLLTRNVMCIATWNSSKSRLPTSIAFSFEQNNNEMKSTKNILCGTC